MKHEDSSAKLSKPTWNTTHSGSGNQKNIKTHMKHEDSSAKLSKPTWNTTHPGSGSQENIQTHMKHEDFLCKAVKTHTKKTLKIVLSLAVLYNATQQSTKNTRKWTLLQS